MKIWLLLHLAWKRGVAGGKCWGEVFLWWKCFCWLTVCAVLTPSVAFCLFCDGLSQQCGCNKGSSHCFSQCALLSQEQQQRTNLLIKAIALCHFYIVVYLSSLSWIHITANKKNCIRCACLVVTLFTAILLVCVCRAGAATDRASDPGCV